MKKATLEKIEKALATMPEYADVHEEVAAELAKGEAKAAENRKLYIDMHDPVMACIGAKPVSVSEIWEACKDKLPDDASPSKIRYAIREYWASEVVKHDGTPLTYTKA